MEDSAASVLASGSMAGYGLTLTGASKNLSKIWLISQLKISAEMKGYLWPLFCSSYSGMTVM